VGSLVARKRVELLLDALESLPGSGLALTLLGDLDREPAYARAIARRIEASDALRSTVTMAGVVGDDALAGWFARADALVLPSSLEGYGMVLTEALHAGLPVIAARPAADAAALADLGAVRVFDHAGDLAELLRRFAGDPALREAMRHAAATTLLPTWSEAIAAFRVALVGAQRRGP
jgi:glycosyltransferase involved in cell wall biosynthesis